MNFYPFSKRRSIYINSTIGRIGFPGSAPLAIEAAKGHLARDRRTRPTSGARLRFKKALLKKDPRCFDCHTGLTHETATLDHIIPIAKGGTNADGNFQLACQPCNLKKADRMPRHL